MTPIFSLTNITTGSISIAGGTREIPVAYCLGYGKSLMHSHLPCCKRKSLIDLCMSRNCATPIAWLAKSPFIVLL